MVDDPFSLFKKSSGNPKKNAGRSLPSSSPAQTPSKRSDLTNTEIYQMIEQMRKMHDDLELQLDEIYQKSGLDPKKIKNYLENPNNFATKVWEKIQQERQSLLLKVGLHPNKEVKLSDTRSTKERKGKTLGSRRNWIQM